MSRHNRIDRKGMPVVLTKHSCRARPWRSSEKFTVDHGETECTFNGGGALRCWCEGLKNGGAAYTAGDGECLQQRQPNPGSRGVDCCRGSQGTARDGFLKFVHRQPSPPSHLVPRELVRPSRRAYRRCARLCVRTSARTCCCIAGTSWGSPRAHARASLCRPAHVHRSLCKSATSVRALPIPAAAPHLTARVEFARHFLTDSMISITVSKTFEQICHLLYTY